MKKITSLLLIFVLVLGMFSGCKKDKGDPPVLPPAESMIIDFSNFIAGKKSAENLLSKGDDNSNWEFSALVAGYWRALLFTTLAVPVTTFGVVSDQTPVYIEDKTWQWSYTAVVFTATYNARLVGQIRTNDVAWTMYISKEGSGAFPEFIWFEGTSKLDGTSGTWTLNHSYTFQEPVLKIDWTKSGASMGSITYTYVRTLTDGRLNDPFKTSSIEYGISTGTYNAYYSIHYYNGASFSDVDVEWSTSGHNGRVMCVPYFSDALWHCWDGNFINVNCPL